MILFAFPATCLNDGHPLRMLAAGQPVACTLTQAILRCDRCGREHRVTVTLRAEPNPASLKRRTYRHPEDSHA